MREIKAEAKAKKGKIYLERVTSATEGRVAFRISADDNDELTPLLNHLNSVLGWSPYLLVIMNFSDQDGGGAVWSVKYRHYKMFVKDVKEYFHQKNISSYYQ